MNNQRPFFIPWIESSLGISPKTHQSLYNESYNRFKSILNENPKCPYCGMNYNNCGCGYLKGELS